MLEHTLVFGTIAAALVCWALGEALRSRSAWMAGALLSLVHSVAAFGVFYDWSHATAQLMTQKQTAALTGIDFAGGIYINYVFLAVWLVDAAWWCLSPTTYAARARVLSFAIRGFLFFIMVNGTVVFADGGARVLGFVCIGIVLTAWINHKRQTTHSK